MNKMFKNSTSTNLSTNNFIHIKAKKSISKVTFNSPIEITSKERPSNLDFGQISTIGYNNFDNTLCIDETKINDFIVPNEEDNSSNINVNKTKMNYSQDPNIYTKEEDTTDISPIKNKTFTNKRQHQRFHSQIFTLQGSSWALDILENASTNNRNQEVKQHKKPSNVNTIMSSLFGSCTINQT